ncbi:MAG TPA: nuclear transport factor 2 family protein [Egibacteraceae bacterium]|jgi:ketosteroid isomerase-like protein|nr:nuclear transport factor 2 family protein [Egibacteraceae bacterium]
MTTATDIIRDTFDAEQEQLEATLHGIMDAVQSKDFARLAAHHLYSPKFTKFDDFEPLDRQDAATAQQSEEEGLGGVENFHYQLDDLKVDVFGPVAIATFVFGYGFDADGEAMSVRARSTMVFVNDNESWKIAHEHFSPFKSNP